MLNPIAISLAKMIRIWPYDMFFSNTPKGRRYNLAPMKISENTLVAWPMSAAMSLAGKPLRVLWDKEILIAIGFSATEGELLDRAQIDRINHAIENGNYVVVEHIESMTIYGQKAMLPTHDSIMTATLTMFDNGDGPGYIKRVCGKDDIPQITYNVINESELLRQLTGFTWIREEHDPEQHLDLLAEGIEHIYGERETERTISMRIVDAVSRITTTDDTTEHLTSFYHPSGMVAILRHIEQPDTGKMHLEVTFVIASNEDDRRFVTRSVELP